MSYKVRDQVRNQPVKVRFNSKQLRAIQALAELHEMQTSTFIFELAMERLAMEDIKPEIRAA